MTCVLGAFLQNAVHRQDGSGSLQRYVKRAEIELGMPKKTHAADIFDCPLLPSQQLCSYNAVSVVLFQLWHLASDLTTSNNLIRHTFSILHFNSCKHCLLLSLAMLNLLPIWAVCIAHLQKRLWVFFSAPFVLNWQDFLGHYCGFWANITLLWQASIF